MPRPDDNERGSVWDNCVPTTGPGDHDDQPIDIDDNRGDDEEPPNRDSREWHDWCYRRLRRRMEWYWWLSFEEWGEAVKAVVSTVDGGEVTEEELIEFCRDHIASYKKPRSVDFVDDLPRNNYGKIVKRELREAYWQGRERRV